jgi:hypothetical protein
LAERLNILLSGMVAGDPHQGGATWAVLQYFYGLRALGHDVALVEPVGGQGRAKSLSAGSEAVAYFESLSLPEDRAVLLRRGTDQTVGMAYDAIAAFAAEADLLINISGMLRDERLLEQIPVRAFLDLDPGFNQVWHQSGEDMGFDLHTHWVTVGQALGRPDCPIPTCGRNWIVTVPPVALEHWSVAAEAPSRDAFTTVGHWRSYGSIEYEGVRYGQRAHSLRELIDLPRSTDARFQLALGIHRDEVADLEALHSRGWELLDPAAVAGGPRRYAEFIRGSKAELSVAKSGYVASRSGWFSDRSACYLASGRPVVAQETGFSEFLPTGAGLLPFSTLDEAIVAVDDVERSWQRQSRSAREIAEEYFDSRKVLSELLEELGSTGGGA